jgi:beta-lactam-binding protein with PASTA domain/tRNA A-37 threonylcarbamoyl transferase component Bud32
MTQLMPSRTDQLTASISLRAKQGGRTGVIGSGPGPAARHASLSNGAPSSHNRYQTAELLGRGGMAEVYRAVDTLLGRAVAIKRMRTDMAVNPVYRSRFRREALAAGRLNHPAIVAVYDTGEERDAAGASIPFIVMELVEGRSLRDVLCNGEKILPERALELTVGVLDALACSHAAGIVHRDIKPGNVMLTSSGAVKVADFGIAHAVSDGSGTVTLAGTVLGTAQYLSPEQARGKAVDVRSDIYSVGCLLYELLVGRPPFTGDSPVSVVFQHVSEAPDPPSSACSDICADIDAVTLKALAKDPDDRYQTAAEMKADIESVLNGRHPPVAAPVPAQHPSADDRHGVRPRRRLVSLLAAITAVLIVGMGAAALDAWRPSQAQDTSPPTVEVPAVMGLSRVGAESLLRNAHLVPRFEFVNGADDVSVDTAINQRPRGGVTAAPDSAVIVTINVGSRRAAIPRNLIGLDVDKATKTLRLAGFMNIKIEKALPSTQGVFAGQVMSIDPAEGRTVRLAERITVTYAGGAERAPQLGVTQPRVSTKGSGQNRPSDSPPGRLARQSDTSGAAGAHQAEGDDTKKSEPKKDSGDLTKAEPGKEKGGGDGGQGGGLRIDPKSLLPLDSAGLP